MRDFFKKSGRVLIVLLVIVAVIGGWLYIRRNRNAAANTLQTATIERGNLTATIGATGTVRAKQTAVLTWQTTGQVDTVNVKVGDNVPQGFVMAFLSKTSLSQNIILAEADLANAKSALDDLLNSDTALAQAAINLRTAQDAYNKAKDNRESLNGLIDLQEIKKKKQNTPFGVIEVTEIKKYKGYADKTTIAKSDERLALAKAQFDDAQRVYDRLSAGNAVEIASAQTRVDAAQATLNLTRVVAPFPGIVTESYPLRGDQVTPGVKAFRLDDLSSLYVDVEVSEVDINSVKVGQTASLSFDAILGKTYQGQVVEVAKVGSVNSGIVSFTVTVELTDADDLVKPGMTAAVNIVVNQLNDVVLVPNRAVRTVNGERVVYLLKDGKSIVTKIILGSSSDTMSVLAGGDVKEGDLVILNPPTSFGGGSGGPRGVFGG